MNWRTKALIQRCVASLPDAVSNQLYFRLQRHLGGLRPSRIDPTSRLLRGMEICREIVAQGRTPRGADFIEIGTGWRLNLPIACWLCGARSVWTLDLNRYLQFSLVCEDLRYLQRHRDELLARLRREYGDVLDETRWRRLVEYQPTNFADLSALCSINYLAPTDARETSFAPGSFDFHVSANVFEHVPPEVLRGILTEANRILKPDGLLVHRVDHSDHFSHFDRKLPAIHFLRYTDAQWRRYAGHRFAYVNRLREDDYISLFDSCGQRIRAVRSEPDAEVQKSLMKSFPLDARFRDKATDTLSRLLSVFVAAPQPACVSASDAA
jgi:SAM-dependent methyltransferase